MHDDLMQNLDECVELIRQAPIKDDTRAFLINQSTIYALFVSDLVSGRLSADKAQGNPVTSMIELINEFCTQVRDLIYGARAA
jgi:hypothetical protein